MISIVALSVMEKSYEIAVQKTGTSGIMPNSSKKGVTLTVISVLYIITAFLPPTGESARESSFVLEVEADVDDAEIFSTTLLWCATAEDISNLSPVSTSSASSSFQLLILFLSNANNLECYWSTKDW